ncbi:DUF3168 domain-containing protein [Hymenobacter cheonanensis]|uniref:DUF3168 domain-containing protein n=1 Tax=Hymenobacter sp. CA2-7 TaxID=3063993 RepID=UPI002713F98C|nr:DUF3168 domain-containing protein [Hymenobacter sp. CA2-7]MDO7888286.1 DUF3168 domain-containing protein [Hymenobacter sp. CA2-7]
MEPGALLFSLLSQAPSVVALLGTRIFPILAPQTTPFPYLTYQVISQNGNETMGCILEDDARVQLSIFAKTYAEVCTIAAATRAALAGQEVGTVLLTFDGNRDQASDPTTCYFRTQDYLLTGLTP